MSILDHGGALHKEATAWRRHLHSIPELSFDVFETAAFVADKLRDFGCDEVVTGIGRTGVVGLINSRAGGSTVGFRADMDALPIQEQTGSPWVSKIPGRMHACGHDGHTAMLLGAAKYLAETRNFPGRVAVIFQPAEEDGGGSNEMVKEGLMERFGISKVFGMHSAPGLPVSHFAMRPGPIMAETLEFVVTITGKGGHAARPNETIDPIVIGSQIVGTLQTVVSRSVNPLDSLVVSVTKFEAGSAFNIIADQAQLCGTIRSLRKQVTESARQRIKTICEGQAALLGGRAEVEFIPSYPVTFNHLAETRMAAAVATRVSGSANVDTDVAPSMGGEDFSYMLEARPGAYIFIGNGDGPGLHNPGYDFNDEAIPYGISYWAQLAEAA
jgi:hippurate hydrolase